MAQQISPIKFVCYTCKVENTYPAIKGDKKDSAKTVIKRCLNCSTENLIELPDGWSVERTGIIVRGMEPNEND
ncbi:hypothetical protein [Flavilitoribacter nigricans]|uniref:Uncharacterized protein n=1 Tax=Flavilitoribacter nigricans (strain ATCC 23147 / DSM 23189 / NBRC 102662 / NCIMB 1420 / SS-2) TaxID=1122177 RepID=A0A2D0MWR4_FLAN2|nr:hypothetical protein [Flavilitoribacter nigricans]PHN00722.1 hypothetical protein CRP01_40780 [Flavilitoribacter nigricans DSM 23189 = NBRC 102662]